MEPNSQDQKQTEPHPAPTSADEPQNPPAARPQNEPAPQASAPTPGNAPESVPASGTSQAASRPVIPIHMKKTKPIMTWSLIGFTTIIYLLQVWTNYKYQTDLPLLFGAKYGPYIKAGQWWRLITPVFLHGSFLHYLFNMYALYVMGPELESVYRRLDFLVFYLITDFTGNAMSFAVSPDSVSIGASTALFGLIAAQGMLIVKNRKFIRNYRKSISNIIFIILINLSFGLTAGNIDNWGHLGGLIGGALMAYLSGPVLGIAWNPTAQYFEFRDTVSRKNRWLSCLICVLFFAALCVAASSRA